MQQGPDDLVLVGRIAGAWGVKGAVKVVPYGDADALISASQWWIGQAGEVRQVDVAEARLQMDVVVATLSELPHREAAQALRGTDVHVRRSDFPPLGTDEFYWVDLIGLSVVNLAGESLGAVRGVMETGAHPVLDVVDGDVNRLIPFVDPILSEVDLAGRRITVDWARDFE